MGSVFSDCSFVNGFWLTSKREIEVEDRKRKHRGNTLLPLAIALARKKH